MTKQRKPIITRNDDVMTFFISCISIFCWLRTVEIPLGNFLFNFGDDENDIFFAVSWLVSQFQSVVYRKHSRKVEWRILKGDNDYAHIFPTNFFAFDIGKY